MLGKENEKEERKVEVETLKVGLGVETLKVGPGVETLKVGVETLKVGPEVGVETGLAVGSVLAGKQECRLDLGIRCPWSPRGKIP